jgi:hypothetical protein
MGFRSKRTFRLCWGQLESLKPRNIGLIWLKKTLDFSFCQRKRFLQCVCIFYIIIIFFYILIYFLFVTSRTARERGVGGRSGIAHATKTWIPAVSFHVGNILVRAFPKPLWPLEALQSCWYSSALSILPHFPFICFLSFSLSCRTIFALLIQIIAQSEWPHPLPIDPD